MEYIIGKKNGKIDFPSQEIWLGVANMYAIKLTENQVRELHNKIHLLEKELGKVLL